MRTLLAAVRRELLEELARDDLCLGPWIGRRCVTFWLGRWMTQRELWLLCRRAVRRRPAHLASLSAEAIQKLRWWSADELRSSQIVTPTTRPICWTGSPAGTSPTPTSTLAT